MAITKEKNKLCWCGCEEFWIQKPNKHYEIICCRCKCHRGIITPGVSVDEYSTDIPFHGEVPPSKRKIETKSKVSNNTEE